MTKENISFVTIIPWCCTEFPGRFPEFSMFREIPEYYRFVALATLFRCSRTSMSTTWTDMLDCENDAPICQHQQQSLYNLSVITGCWKQTKDNTKHQHHDIRDGL